MMKILLSVLVLLGTNAYGQLMTPDTIFSYFKIEKIESVKDNYIIYATHADILYKIVSQKTFKINAEKIRKGKIYKMHLVSFFKIDPYSTSINSVEVSPGCIVRRLDETKQLYYSKDLTGLYLSPLSIVYKGRYSLLNYPKISGCFKIENIQQINDVFIIEAVKDSISYWIASAKSNYSTNQLKKDSVYFMDIFSYFDKGNDFTRIIDGLVEVRPRTLIKPNPETGQLYFSYDVSSNCYDGSYRNPKDPCQ